MKLSPAVSFLLLSLLTITGCKIFGPEDDPLSAHAPKAPQQNDPAYTVTGLRQWYLISNDLTPGTDRLSASIACTSCPPHVNAWIEGRHAGRFERRGGTIPIDIGLPSVPGSMELLLSANGRDTAFARFRFERSHPLYIVVSNDWDNPRDSSGHFIEGMRRAEDLHALHPELIITHFAGPYAFTDDLIPQSRQQYYRDWLLGMRDNHGDEIGMHIHPYCNFVRYAGIPCIIDSSWTGETDTLGYQIGCDRYDEEEFLALLRTADSVFTAQGLGKPTSFRAGGWLVGLHTLRALGRAGYVADASGCNTGRFEEVKGSILHNMLMEIWPSISDTSQPYYPSIHDLSKPGPEVIPVLQVPDNGILVDYVTGDEMIEIFHRNWPGGSLSRPLQVSVGYHPDSFDHPSFIHLSTALAHYDRFRASQDAGPVVYARTSDLVKVWKRP